MRQFKDSFCPKTSLGLSEKENLMKIVESMQCQFWAVYFYNQITIIFGKIAIALICGGSLGSLKVVEVLRVLQNIHAVPFRKVRTVDQKYPALRVFHAWNIDTFIL